MNLRSKRVVLALIGVVCAGIFAAGMFAAFVNRKHTICRDGKPPAAQRGAILGQVAYRCHDGRTVTLNN